MEIIIEDEVRDETLAFLKSEWRHAEIEYFGKPIDWKRTKKVLQLVENGDLLGVLELTIQAGVMELESLVVHHDHRRKGVGEKLVRKAEQVAHAEKLHKIFLKTGKSWHANEFYKKMGYTKTGDLPNHLAGQDYVEYSKLI